MEISTNILLLTIMVVAFLYSSVGHGGASGYTAVMVLFNIAPVMIRPSALVLNVLVSSLALFFFYNRAEFKWKIFLLLVVTSVPAAYLGASIVLHDDAYRRILGIMLIFPFIKLILPSKKVDLEKENDPGYILPLLAGALAGFASGLVGIGGGILINPLLVLLKWTDVKTASAISAAFILVNSISGLTAIAGHASLNNEMIFMLTTAFLGGITGSFLGSKKFNNMILRRILAVVLFIAITKLITI